MRNALHAMARWQKRVQLSLAALHAELNYADASGAENRVLVIHAQPVDLRDPDMGDVALIIKVMPESPEIDREKIKEQIMKALPRVQEIREEPIGFGLVALQVAVVVPDAEGQTEAVENALNAIDGVERAEIVGSTLL